MMSMYNVVLLIGYMSLMRTQAEKCDERFCYFIERRIQMNSFTEIFNICQNTNPSSQLLLIVDLQVQTSINNFFVSDLNDFNGEQMTYVPLALHRNNFNQWVWMKSADGSVTTPPSFSNWDDGNPINTFNGSDCTFFTPQQNSKWWNSLCSSKNVAIICMRDQQTFLSTPTNRLTPATPQATRTTGIVTTTTTTTTMIPTTATTTTSTSIQVITTTTTPSTSTTTTTTPSTSTTTTTTIPSSTTTLSSTSTTTTTTIPSSTTTSSSTTTTTTTTTSAAQNQQLSTTTTSIREALKNNSNDNNNNDTNSGNTANQSEEGFRKNLGIGLGVSLGCVFIICLVTILVTHFCNRKRQISKFSSVTDVDHTSNYKLKNIDPSQTNEIPGAEDLGSSDSGYDNEETKLESPVEAKKVYSPPPPEDENIELNTESDETLNISQNVGSSIESGIENTGQFDWDYPSHTVSSKKSWKKVTFDLDHVVEIPN